MSEHYKLKGGIMPSFPELTIPEIQDKDDELKEIGQFIVKTQPLGFRGYLKRIKCISKLLKRVPYTTGSVPKFELSIKHYSNIQVLPFSIIICEKRNNDEPRIVGIGESDEGTYTQNVEGSLVARSGEYTYFILLQSKVNAQCNSDIIAFKALAQEDITILILCLLFGLLSAAVGSLLTWIFTK